MRLPIRAGSASAATSFTIAFAKLADVIIDIKLLKKNSGAETPLLIPMQVNPADKPHDLHLSAEAEHLALAAKHRLA
jgi:hypothetical protein